MGKIGGRRNFGYGKQMAWAGKNALADRYGEGGLRHPGRSHRAVAAIRGLCPGGGPAAEAARLTPVCVIAGVMALPSPGKTREKPEEKIRGQSWSGSSAGRRSRRSLRQTRTTRMRFGSRR